MTAPSPDDLPGLVEAVAEAIINADLPEGVTPRRTESWMVEARAAYAAMVEHLGLVEEERSGCGHHIGSCFKPEHHDRWIKRRLVTPWREVQP